MRADAAVIDQPREEEAPPAEPVRRELPSPEWAEVLRLIPGYDPIATAEDCWFDPQAAERACGFFPSCLRHYQDWFSGKAGDAFVLQPWQQAIVANLFGWKRPDGTRRYREAFLYIPRKQGKTQLASGIGNYMLFCDGERGAQVYAAAANEEQAQQVFTAASEQVLREEVLSEVAHVYKRRIVVESAASYFQVLTSKPRTKHGFNAHCVIADELHAIEKRDLVEVLVTSTASRRQPLVVYITTADFERASICNEKHDYACKVRDRVFANKAFLPVVYEARKGEDWTSEDIWRRVNPNFGITVPASYFATECQRAKDEPSYENTFKRLHLNMRTEQATRWIQMDRWDACPADVDPESLKGKECVAGLDLSSTQDTTSLVLVFKLPDGRVAVLPWVWVPAAQVRRRERRGMVEYATWVRQDHLHEIEGNVVDYDVVRAKVNALGKVYKIKEIAVDEWQAIQTITDLQGDGFNVVRFRQGFKSMSSPSKELERLVVSGRLIHFNHPVLRWMASNVKVATDPAENVKPVKEDPNSPNKIDGIVALVMALGRAGVAEPAKKSIYLTRGLASTK